MVKGAVTDPGVDEGELDGHGLLAGRAGVVVRLAHEDAVPVLVHVLEEVERRQHVLPDTRSHLSAQGRGVVACLDWHWAGWQLGSASYLEVELDEELSERQGELRQQRLESLPLRALNVHLRHTGANQTSPLSRASQIAQRLHLLLSWRTLSTSMKVCPSRFMVSSRLWTMRKVLVGPDLGPRACLWNVMCGLPLQSGGVPPTVGSNACTCKPRPDRE